MDRDGTRSGFDTGLLQAICRATRLPVVASGGVGTLAHFIEGANAGATGLLAASVFHFGVLQVPQVKAALAEAGPPGACSVDFRVKGSHPSRMPKETTPRGEESHKAEKIPPLEDRKVGLGRHHAGGARPGFWSVVLERQNADPALSHSARLLSRGTAKVAQKFGEEAVECLIEAVAGNAEALVAESADVLYHLLVLWGFPLACIPPTYGRSSNGGKACPALPKRRHGACFCRGPATRKIP